MQNLLETKLPNLITVNIFGYMLYAIKFYAVANEGCHCTVRVFPVTGNER